MHDVNASERGRTVPAEWQASGHLAVHRRWGDDRASARGHSRHGSRVSLDVLASTERLCHGGRWSDPEPPWGRWERLATRSPARGERPHEPVRGATALPSPPLNRDRLGTRWAVGSPSASTPEQWPLPGGLQAVTSGSGRRTLRCFF